MAYTTNAKVAALMALPDFDSNTIPTDTEVTNLITLADRRVDNIEVTTTTVEKELLSTLATAQMIARAPGLFKSEQFITIADKYRQDYNDVLQEIRNKVQSDVGPSHAYGRMRKVN